MPEQGYIRESVVRGDRPDTGVERYCAYNQSRERFLCSEVAAGDFASSGLETQLRTLTPGSGAALWIVPFRGISPTSVRTPIDLIYLDRNCVVTDVVESFPLAGTPSSRVPAASVLALPANTISSTETRPGDHLALCAPDEMKRRLKQILAAKTNSEAESTAAAGDGQTTRSTSGRVLQWIDRSRPRPAADESATAPAPVEQLTVLEAEPALAPPPIPAETPAQPAQKKTASKNWLQRLLSPEPADPRQAPREFLEGLAAYFFTGGDSRPHLIRDISRSGMYVCTEERWYPGTVIRMTLTDQRDAAQERSITVNAFAIRWGNDGVGLKFVFPDEKALRDGRSPLLDGVTGGASQVQLDQFLKNFRNGIR